MMFFFYPSQTPYHDKVLTEWIDTNKDDYRRVQYVGPEEAMPGADAMSKPL